MRPEPLLLATYIHTGGVSHPAVYRVAQNLTPAYYETFDGNSPHASLCVDGQII